MKKIRLKVALLVTLVAAVFTSCDKDVESSAVTISINDSAVIQLYVYANLDLTDAGMEAVPAGTPLSVKINYNDFKPGLDGALISTESVGENGMVSFNVPADQNGITVRITPQPFTYDQVQMLNKYEQTLPKLYTANNENISVSAGEKRIVEIEYNTPELISGYTEMTKISGKITAEIEEDEPGEDDVSTTFTLLLNSADWSANVAVTGGEFEAEVPYGVKIYATGTFTEVNNLIAGNEDYEYEINGLDIGGEFYEERDDIIIPFGTGIEVEN